MTDFRLPENRRETFWTAFEFHLKFKTMPGLVYGYFPYLAEKLNWTMEDKLWFAFLNGNTQNPSTSWIIFQNFRSIADLDVDEFDKWYFSETCSGKLMWQALPFDLDRRHFRNKLHMSIRTYKENLNGMSQEDFFMQYCNTDDKFQNFANLWDRVYKGDKKNGVKKFFSFGRLSSFSYIEYLWIMGLPLDCDRFFAEDYKGSSSHRNGTCWVIGREDLDEHKSNPYYNKGDVLHNKDIIAMLDREMEKLYREGLERFKDNPEILPFVSRFTIESQLCNYKSWHRPSRRYPNVYGDMAYDRLKKVEAMEEFKGYNFMLFWEARLTFMPTEIRPEGNPENLGVTSFKQNLYRLTGKQHTLGLINDAYDGVPRNK